MPILSSPLLLRTHSLTLLTISYYLFISPERLFSSTPIWLLGESMGVRPAAFAVEEPIQPSSSTNTRLEASALLQNTSTTQGMGGEAERELCVLVVLVVLMYAGMQFVFAGDLTLLPAQTSANSSKRSGSTTVQSSSRYGEELHTLLTAQSRWLTLAGLHVLVSSVLVGWIYLFHSHSSSTGVSGLHRLANRVILTVGLADMLFWGYLWTVLKEEGREVTSILARRRQMLDDDED
ncbi:uncharacterized protein Z518_02208 [Rhinocladiella mackenziei CBS 650.93]|uniref:Uncharacterized protein n=1 Tax=Rhinocladiella mackenziei CBS 650.93 TaxID=1442369 RepID=A0A0D2JEG7_9EURO|nr:uncharacterized protein Z518_02208 [Rhinocladiella mackenziei CBS 650.93]KIX07555.1 hypothetical protein Z518_02208 [Rhinocladiella mackenziei CBS 650.93]